MAAGGGCRIARRGLSLWILTVLGGAVAGALYGWVPTVGVNWPWFANLGASAIIFIALAAVPWIGLSRRWVWWLGSAIGAIVGVPVAVYTTFSLFGLGRNPSIAPTENLVLFSLVIGLFGVGQALSLGGWSRKLGWLMTSLVAGAVFGAGFQVVSTIVGSNPATPTIGPSIVAGVGCGAVLGAGTLLLRRRAKE